MNMCVTVPAISTNLLIHWMVLRKSSAIKFKYELETKMRIKNNLFLDEINILIRQDYMH